MNQLNIFQKVTGSLLFGTVILLLVIYFQGYNLSIDWNVTTTAESSNYYTLPFQKGPFQFSFQTDKYELAETFSAGPITRNITMEMGLSLFSFLGILLLLAICTYLPRYWFIGVMAAFMFFIINMHLPEIGIFGLNPRSSFSTIIILIGFIGPLYAFHAFWPNTSLAIRFATIIIVTGLIILFSGVDALALHDQYVSGGYFGFIILGLIFLFLVAEENVFGILFLITQSKGGKNNHVHFSVFTAVYLGVILAYYGIRARFWTIDLPYFDAYVLLAISAIVGFWSIPFKKDFIAGFLTINQAKILYAAIGVAVLSFIGLSMLVGNDPMFQGFHYFIVYAHLAFGIMFYLYLFWNFISPLGQGLQVYKIAYKSQSFPYISAKLAGAVAVAGFFFLANKEPLQLIKAGSYNFRGVQTEDQGNVLLADEYFREGSIYGFDNHFSNYKLGYKALQDGDTKLANYRFKRASQRYPSPQSFVNTSSTHAMLNESTASLVTLQEGLKVFKGNSQLLNNLGLTYLDLGNFQKATEALESSTPKSGWTNANLVNLWKVVQPDTALAKQDYDRGNLAVKTNVLSNLIDAQKSIDIAFDTASLYPSFAIHRLGYLINASNYFNDELVAGELEKSLSGQLDEQMYFAGRNAAALNYFKSGNINKALEAFDFLVGDVPSRNQGKYLNQMGLIALSQQNPYIALEFFRQASAKGHQDAYSSQLACLLELRQFEGAESWLTYLCSLDTSYLPIKNDLALITSNRELSTDQQLFRLYYRYDDFSSGVINAILPTADRSYCNSLWQKIAREQLLNRQYDKYKTYRAVFNSFVDQDLFTEPDLILDLISQKQTNQKHPITSILSLDSKETKAEKLKQYGLKNALNEPMTLVICDLLNDLNQSMAYDVLVSSININKSSVALHKAYVMSALGLGLNTYANDGLAKLQAITTTTDFNNFKKEFENKKLTLDENTSW